MEFSPCLEHVKERGLNTQRHTQRDTVREAGGVNQEFGMNAHTAVLGK